MKNQEARDKFGRTYIGDDGEEQWEINPNKVRGMLLKYSEETDYLEGSTDTPRAEEYIDHFWGWVKDKVGVGYKGILQCQFPSPSGRFDRLSKSEAIDIADAYYDNHPTFRENMDEAWEKKTPRVEDPQEYGSTEEMLRDMNGKEVIETFYFIYDGHDMLIPGKKQAPDRRAYKYHIKQWVAEKDAIDADSDGPNAEELVELWIEWMAEEILTLESPLVYRDGDGSYNPDCIPEVERVYEWCRELYRDSTKFREQVKEKWGKELEDEKNTGPSASDMNKVGEEQRQQVEERGGQQSLTSY